MGRKRKRTEMHNVYLPKFQKLNLMTEVKVINTINTTILNEEDANTVLNRGNGGGGEGLWEESERGREGQ